MPELAGAIALPRLAHPLLAVLLALGGCAGGASEVAELSPETFGLAMRGNSGPEAARRGVERAQRFCAERQQTFEVVRSEIGVNDYTIAFRCQQPPQPEAPLAFDGPVFSPAYSAPRAEPPVRRGRSRTSRLRGLAPAGGGEVTQQTY